MRIVGKYPLVPEQYQQIEARSSRQWLKCEVQHERPCLWAIIDTTTPLCNVKIGIFGTGTEIPKEDEATYIGSFMMNGGTFVFHVFEMHP